MADPLRITVGSSTADENPYASFEASSPYYDPVQIDPRSRDLVVRTIFGEAADKDEAGRAAVANVIRNRVASGRYGTGAEGVIKKPWAFEPWHRADARARMLGLREDDPNYQNIAKIVDDIFSGVVQDPTQGATHFYAPRAQTALGRNAPAWAKGQPLANVGGHLFYAPEGAVRGTPSSPAPDRGGAVPSSPQAPPSIQPDERVQLASLVSQAQNTAPVEDNPYAKFTPGAVPAPWTPTIAQKPALPPEMQTPMSQSEAFGQGVQQGATFGWSDELRGLAAAFDTVPGSAAGAGSVALELAKLAWGSYQQNPNSATLAAYNTAVTEARRRLVEAKRQYPGTVLGGELTGSAIVPLPGGPLTGAGRSTMSRVGSGMMQGGIAGGLTGAGSAEGDILQRVGPALTGTAGGAVAGGGIAATAPTIANYIGRAIHGILSPAKQAESTIARTAAEASRTAPQSRVLPHQVTPDTMVADILGEPGRVLARSTKNISPVAADVMQGAVEDRARGQFPRLVSFLENKVGPLGDNEMAKLAVRAEAAQVNSPLYRQAMDLYWQGVTSPELLRLLGSNTTLQGAGRTALERVTNRAAVERRNAPSLDSLEFWDQVKREIQSQISVAKRAGDNETVNELTGLSRNVIRELDGMTGGPNGSYAQARASAEQYFGVTKAIEDGQRFIKTNQYTPQMAANDLRGRSPDAQDAFRRAALSQLLDKMGLKNDSHDIWKKLNASPDAQAKLRVLFNGDQGLIREFEAMHHAENLMERLRNAVRGNSSTAQQLIAAGVLGGGGVPISMMTGNTSYLDPTTPGGAALYAGGALGARKFADRRMAEHLARQLISNDPAVIQRAVQAAAGDVRIMNVLRTMAENAGSRAAGSQVGRSIGD